MHITPLTEDFAVTAQISSPDVALIKAAGYDTIICNRPDGEEFGQPTAEMIKAACKDLGINFHYIPMAGAPGPTTLDDFRSAVRGASGKVLAYCRSGNRSSILFNAIRG